MHPDLAHVESWIFDLDNSLYPHSCNLFELIDLRMGEYIQHLLGVDAVEARRVQKDYFHAHGTTLAGLMADARRRARAISSISSTTSISPGSPPIRPWSRRSTRCRGASSSSPMPSEDYARRVLDRLGLANAFDGMHDIHAMAYVPKPDPSGYRGDLRGARHRSEARARSPTTWSATSQPAKAIGMTTFWVDNGSEQGPATSPRSGLCRLPDGRHRRLAGRGAGGEGGMTAQLQTSDRRRLGGARRPRHRDTGRGPRRGRGGAAPARRRRGAGRRERRRAAGRSISG